MSQRKRKTRKKATFEEKLSRLENIVERLEHGGLDLDEAMQLFREGTTLVNELSEMLREAELEIENMESSLGKA